MFSPIEPMEGPKDVETVMDPNFHTLYIYNIFMIIYTYIYTHYVCIMCIYIYIYIYVQYVNMCVRVCVQLSAQIFYGWFATIDIPSC